ncbi:facilitated trehalose transporter Tret1-like [Planococcus citri]|uniref:facilitated trehalose transporter Tret1-like n=1 Tax=Planococcus citri TaxID=170843 RepID=UPI0031F7F375
MKTSTRRVWHQTISVIPVAYSELMMGFGFGWLAPILKSLEDPDSVLPLSLTDASWIASLHEMGRIFGPPISAPLTDVIGRRIILTICSFITFCTWFAILFTRSIPILYVTRFVFGVAVGMYDSVTSIYIAENCSPKIRGTLCSVTVVFFFGAVVVQFALASYLSYDNVALVNLITCGVGVLSTVLLKEPIQSLLLRNKETNAVKNFKYLQGEEDWDALKTEFDIIKKNVEEEKQLKQSLKIQLSNSYNIRCIVIVFILNILTMATGYGAVMAYVTKIIPDYESFTSYEFTICFGAIQFSAVVVSLFIIDRFDRRTLLKVLFFLIALIHLSTGLIYHFYQDDQPKWYSISIFATLTAFAFFYGNVDPIVHITRGELFPQSVKALGCALCVMAHASMGFLTTKMFLIISEAYGIQYNFFMFSSVSFMAFIFTCFFLPEARARTLVDIHTTDAEIKRINTKIEKSESSSSM